MLSLGGIAAGTYTLSASLTNYDSNTTSVTVKEDETTSSSIALTSQGGTVEISVNDGTNPISGAAVTTTVNGTTYSGTTNGSGVATISGVPLGTRTFIAKAAGYVDNMGSITVTTSGGTGTISLTGAGGNVSITVNDGTNPINGVALRTTVNGTTYSGTTNGSGIATISGIPTGFYSFNASAANYADNHCYIAVTTSGGSGTISLTGLGNVAITVYDKSTNSADYTGTTPFAGGTVRVTINGSTYTAVTDSSGVATFNSLPVGTYTFKVTAASYPAWVDTTAHKDVTIAVGSTVSATISVYGRGGAKVTVTDGTNAPISGATVKFYREGSEAMMTLTTDAAGQVISGYGLFTGTYNVKVTKDSSTVTSSYFVVSPGQTTDVSVAFP